MKCNQTGKLFRVKVTVLSRVDKECLTQDDLAEGSQLVMTNNKKSYPVSVQKVVSALGDASAERKSTVHVSSSILIILVFCILLQKLARVAQRIPENVLLHQRQTQKLNTQKHLIRRIYRLQGWRYVHGMVSYLAYSMVTKYFY